MSGSGTIVGSIRKGAHVLGASLIGLGALSALLPGLTGGSVVVAVGLLLALAGVVRAIFGWRAWSAGKGALGFWIGGLAVACGLALVLNPVSTLGTVSSLVAAYMMVDGASTLLFAARLDDDEGRAWMWGDAVFSIGLGVSMWIGWPLSGMRALGVLIGMKLISAGAVLLRVERRLGRLGERVATLRART